MHHQQNNKQKLNPQKIAIHHKWMKAIVACPGVHEHAETDMYTIQHHFMHDRV